MESSDLLCLPRRSVAKTGRSSHSLHSANWADGGLEFFPLLFDLCPPIIRLGGLRLFPDPL